MNPETPQQPAPPAVAPQSYDFRTDRIETMDLSAVEMELSNVYSGDPLHPYLNDRDGRHGAAQQYVRKLHE